jgi:hypothetical protein
MENQIGQIFNFDKKIINIFFGEINKYNSDIFIKCKKS